jgi:hypothetical protein
MTQSINYTIDCSIIPCYLYGVRIATTEKQQQRLVMYSTCATSNLSYSLSSASHFLIIYNLIQAFLTITLYRSLICAIINALTMALMDAGIMTSDMITSCSAGESFNIFRSATNDFIYFLFMGE